MSAFPRIRWTAPRHSGDHVPQGRYLTLVRKPGPRQTTVLFKIGWAGMFEIGFHVRWPNWNRWKFEPWIRIVANREHEDAGSEAAIARSNLKRSGRPPAAERP